MGRMTSGMAAVALLVAAQSATADVIGYEDFQGGAFNLDGTVNVLDFGSGGGAVGDVFGRVSRFDTGTGTGGPFDVWDDSVEDTSGGGVFATDSIAVAGRATEAFFALNDMDGFGGGALNDATWTFDITSALSITNISIDLGAFGDFEASSSDGFTISAQIDGGGYQTIFAAICDEAGSMEYRAFDDGDIFTLNDPLELFIDGGTSAGYLDKSDPATGNFDTYVSTLFAGMSGSSLDIRVSWAGSPSGSEPMGVDNITINGAVPEPGTLALLAAGAVTVIRRRRM